MLPNHVRELQKGLPRLLRRIEASRQAGFIDPLSLAALGFLVISLIVGSFVVSDKGRNFSPFKKAYYGGLCKAEGGECVPTNYVCTEGSDPMDCGSRICGFGTCKAPAVSIPQPPSIPQAPATTTTSETGIDKKIDKKEESSGNIPPPSVQEAPPQAQQQAVPFLPTTTANNIPTIKPTSVPSSTPLTSKEKAGNLDKAEEEISNLSLNLSQTQTTPPSPNPSSAPMATTPTATPKSFLPTPTPSSFPTPSLSPYQDCVQKRGPSECTALLPENQRKYQEYISSLVGTTGTVSLSQTGTKTIGQTCKESTECESGNCQAVPRGRFCLAKGTKYAPLIPEGAITVNPVPITISTTSGPDITPRSIDYKKYEDACKGKAPGTICNIDSQLGACSQGAVPLCELVKSPIGGNLAQYRNLPQQAETAVIEAVSNLPLVGPNRIYQSLQIAASGSQYSQEALLPDLYAPGGVRRIKIGAGEVALANYVGLTDITNASNRLFYQTGLSESEAQEYNAYVANRFGDAATVGLFAVGTAAQITSPWINPETLAGKPVSSTYNSLETVIANIPNKITPGSTVDDIYNTLTGQVRLYKAVQNYSGGDILPGGLAPYGNVTKKGTQYLAGQGIDTTLTTEETIVRHAFLGQTENSPALSLTSKPSVANMYFRGGPNDVVITTRLPRTDVVDISDYFTFDKLPTGKKYAMLTDKGLSQTADLIRDTETAGLSFKESMILSRRLNRNIENAAKTREFLYFGTLQPDQFSILLRGSP